MAVVQVRNAQVGDGAGCAEVWRDAGAYLAALNPDLAQTPVPARLTEWFDATCDASGQRDEQLFLVATVDDQISGLLLATLLQPRASAALQLERDLGRTRVRITVLAVSKKYRRTGAATALVEAARKWALASGAEVMLLETETNNALAVPFAKERMGFDARLVTFRKDLLDS